METQASWQDRGFTLRLNAFVTQDRLRSTTTNSRCSCLLAYDQSEREGTTKTKRQWKSLECRGWSSLIPFSSSPPPPPGSASHCSPQAKLYQYTRLSFSQREPRRRENERLDDGSSICCPAPASSTSCSLRSVSAVWGTFGWQLATHVLLKRHHLRTKTSRSVLPQVNTICM